MMNFTLKKQKNYTKLVQVRVSEDMHSRAKRLNLNLSMIARDRWAQVIMFLEQEQEKKNEK